MPNQLIEAHPDVQCTVVKKNGKRCGSVALRGTTSCLFHSPKEDQERCGPSRVDPSHPLSTLLKSDITAPGTVAVLANGLAEHVAAGSLKHQEAESILRLRKEALAASVRPVSRETSRGRVARLLATHGGRGETDEAGEGEKGPTAATEPGGEPASEIEALKRQVAELKALLEAVVRPAPPERAGEQGPGP